MKKLIFVLLANIFFATTFGQVSERKSKKEARRDRISAITRQEEEGVIKYKKHFAFGVKLTTDGYGGFLEVGKAQSIQRGMLFQLEMDEIKHSKEIKQQREFTANTPVIYGKVNYFYPVKLGVQQQFLLGNKSNKNGISITGNVGGGLSLGLLRPYMIDLEFNGKRAYTSYFEDSTAFLNGIYYRGPGFGTGWNKTKINPGIYLKPAVRFDYGKYNEMINALEVGLAVEYYSKPVQQMFNLEKRSFFLSATVAIIFGRRK